MEALADRRRKALVRPDDGWILTLYLDLAPDETPSRGSAETRFRSLLQRARRLAGIQDSELGREQREAVQALLDELGARAPPDRTGRRSIAFFGSTGDRRWQLASLPRRVEDDVYLGRSCKHARAPPPISPSPPRCVSAARRCRCSAQSRSEWALSPRSFAHDVFRGRGSREGIPREPPGQPDRGGGDARGRSPGARARRSSGRPLRGAEGHGAGRRSGLRRRAVARRRDNLAFTEQTSEARRLAREIVSALESGRTELSASAIERLVYD